MMPFKFPFIASLNRFLANSKYSIGTESAMRSTTAATDGSEEEEEEAEEEENTEW